jgi:N-acetylglucosaminyldiphosphoundecaprenol N-acetyl-beta-D-mannosaminyltransferase
VSGRFTRQAPGRRERADVLGCELDRVDMPQAVSRCEAYVQARSHARHMAVNVAKIVSSRREAQLRRVINGCDLVTADGQAVVWASRLLGDPVPARVTGIDLMEQLLVLADRRGYRIFLLGARPEVLAAATARIRARYPGVDIAGRRDGYFSESDEPGIVAEIREARPDLLFVALPSPRKEYFLAKWATGLDVPFSMGVGGAFDVLAGRTRRAPRPLQRLGLEWAFRLAQEPGRLWRRYLVTNSAFVWMTVRSVANRRRARGPVDRSIERAGM